MADPYSVLGISRNADDAEIKKAYRKLSRKYHPDANVNNPNKAEAEERRDIPASEHRMMAIIREAMADMAVRMVILKVSLAGSVVLILADLVPGKEEPGRVQPMMVTAIICVRQPIISVTVIFRKRLMY